MVSYEIDNLRIGMIVAEDIRTKGGQLVVPRGSTLSQQMIQHMKYYKISSAVILPNEVTIAASHPKEGDKETSYASRLRASEEFREFRKDYMISADIFRTQLTDFVNGDNSLDTDLLLHNTMQLFEYNRRSFSLLDMLHNTRNIDDSTYVHSINVGVISRLIGVWSHVPEDQLDVLTLCGLLHDIGKTQVPSEIIEKPGRLTAEEYEIIKSHTALGYRMIEAENMDHRIKNAILMHHERFDGSGYPFGLTGERIDTFASIVAIADVYDALTSDRVYRTAVCPFEVIAIFENDGLQKYNPNYILTFLEHMALTYIGNNVRLNDGSTGRIMRIDERRLTRPLIQLADGSFADLTKQLDLYVEQII